MKLRWSETAPFQSWHENDPAGMRYCAVIREDGRAYFAAFRLELWHSATGRVFVAREIWRLRKMCREDPALRPAELESV